MEEDKYIRKVQTSVTVSLYHKSDYLMLKRNANKRVDPNKLNGIGGRLEPGENYLDAAIRETEEETGIKLEHKNLELSGIVKLEGGYSEDWIICFFRAEVPTKVIPKGSKTENGELIWIDKDKILDSDFQVIDDLNYTFKDIVTGKNLFFANAQVDKNEKISSISISRLKK